MPRPHQLSAAIAALVLGGCVAIETLAPPVTPALAGGASATTLEAGRSLYVGRCAKCHSVDPVGKYSAPRWREIIADMAERSKLSAPEHEAVLAYVLAARAHAL